MTTRFPAGLALWPLAGLFVVLACSVACDPGHEITFKNNTSVKVTIYFEGRQQGSVNPGEAKAYTHLEYSGAHTWEAKDDQGHILYHADLTWSDIRAQAWTITISGATSLRPAA